MHVYLSVSCRDLVVKAMKSQLVDPDLISAEMYVIVCRDWHQEGRPVKIPPVL